MYKFGQIEISSKEFNSVYQVQNDVNCEKIRISKGVVANKHDTRYIIGYETEPGTIVPLYIKTPRDCLSSGVSRYNEASPWKMGFNVSEDEAWVKDYEAIWISIEECLLKNRLEGKPLNNDKYVNAKLITWDSQIRTRFRGDYPGFIEEIGACHATGILKIGSVYRQGSNYHLQVFLKECKYKNRDISFKSLLSSDDESDSGYDTIH